MKSSLIINSKPPHSSLSAKEAQDSTLAFAAFGIPVGVLFLGDALFQITRRQSPIEGQKHTAATFESYGLYEIEEIYVCREDLSQRGLTLEDLVLKVKLINRAEIKDLFNQYNNLLSF